MHARLTWMEKDVGKLEEKEGLTPSDERKIKPLKQLAKEHECKFEQHQVEVLNFIKAENKVTLESEEAIFNEHVDQVSDMIERLEKLEDLVGTREPVMPCASDKGEGRPGVRSISEAEHLSQRLSQVQDALVKVKRVSMEV